MHSLVLLILRSSLVTSVVILQCVQRRFIGFILYDIFNIFCTFKLFHLFIFVKFHNNNYNGVRVAENVQ